MSELCLCGTCTDARNREIIETKYGGDAIAAWWDEGMYIGMVLCPTCGNKRCPHATYHGYDCTGSNEPGQPGSAYQ